MSEPEINLTKFQQKLAERKAQEEAEAAALAAAKPVFDSEDIPDDPYERSDEDRQMDEIVNSISVIDAYIKWCGKMMPVARPGQREGIKISCPIPGHADRDPSAWVNLDTNLWFCGGCEQGGDTHDLAAFAKGYPVPGYKDGATFHRLRKEMAMDFGWTFKTLPGNITVATPPVEAEPESAETVPAPAPTPDETSATVTPISVDVALTEEDEAAFEEMGREITALNFDWKQVVPADSFLDIYMRKATIDDAPEEFHFFNALVALGMALGKDVRLSDSYPVYGNIFVCTLGRSGVGKSKSLRALGEVLEAALPFAKDDPFTKGCKRISASASAEALIGSFSKEVYDPSDPKKFLFYQPIRGYIEFNELAALVGRTERAGSILKPTLMDFFDMAKQVSNNSVTHGEKIAKDPFASAITTTQPKSLKGLLTKGDDSSGFLNRWLFVWGTEKKRVSVGGSIADMTPAVMPLKKIQGWASTFTATEMVTWSQEAMMKFDNWFHGTFEKDRKNANNDILVRCDLHIKKMCLLLSANKMEKEVSGHTVDEALKFYPFFKACYGIPAGQIGNSEFNECAEAVLAFCQKALETKNKGLTVSEIFRSCRRRNFSIEMINRAVSELVKAEQLEAETTNTGGKGRPTVRYKYVA